MHVPTVAPVHFENVLKVFQKCPTSLFVYSITDQAAVMSMVRPLFIRDALKNSLIFLGGQGQRGFTLFTATVAVGSAVSYIPSGPALFPCYTCTFNCTGGD